MSAPPSLVEVADLGLAYRDGDGWLQVLHGVSFTVAKGEIFGLVGESGCGKSSVAYQLMGYRLPGSRLLTGRVMFDGDDLLRLSRPALDHLRGNRISFVPQDPTTALSPGMRVGDQIAEVLHHHHVTDSRRAARERAVELVRSVGLPDPPRIAHRYPHQLSGGQQQRVIIAMALACGPDLVVLDEPTTGLDVTTQEQILELLRELQARHGMSMLYVTHDLGVLSEIADRVGVMYAGHMVEVAPTAVLFGHPRHPYTRGLVASIPQLGMSHRQAGRPLRGLLLREELPSGCAFYPRCDFAEPSCAANRQSLTSVADSHVVACQRWQDLASPAAVATDQAGETAAAEAAVGPPVLSLEKVSLRYRGQVELLDRLRGKRRMPVVHDVSFTIERGETFALVGQSGSGKSTIARAISGLIAPVAGAIVFEGRPLPGSVRRRSRDLRRRIQYIFQNPDASLNPRVRIGSILARPLEIFFELDRAGVRERVEGSLHDVRLDPSYAARYPDQLSGGERQRIAIARALATDPVLLLCDEILSALDVSVQANILELLRRLKRETEVAMLFISHDLAVVRSLADRVGVLFHGHLVEAGYVDEVFQPPFHPYTYSLLMAVPSIGRERPTPSRRSEPAVAPADDRGCAFAGHCPWQLGKICEEEAPPWREAGCSLRVRCHIPLDELTRQAVWRPTAPPDAAAVQAAAGVKPDPQGEDRPATRAIPDES